MGMKSFLRGRLLHAIATFMKQTKQLQRIFEIDRLIRHGQRPTAPALAERLGVSKRQIYLDRKFLAEALAAPLAIHPQGGWIYTNPTWPLPTVYLAEGEVL